MKVLVNPEASKNYHRRCYIGSHPRCGMLHYPKWVEILKSVEGKWLEVDTKFLFANQFKINAL